MSTPAPPPPVRANTRDLVRVLGILADVGAWQDQTDPQEEQDTRDDLKGLVASAVFFLGYLALDVTRAVTDNAIYGYVAAGCLVVGAVVLVVTFASQFRRGRDTWTWWRHSKRTFLKSVTEALDQEERFLDRLVAFDDVTLTHARDRLRAKVERRQEVVDLVFGQAKGAGALPAVLASGVALWTSLGNTKGAASVAVAMLTVLVWFATYVALELHAATSQLRSMVGLLDHALAVRARAAGPAGAGRGVGS